MLSAQVHCSEDIDGDEHVAALDSCGDDEGEALVVVACAQDDKRVAVVARVEVRMKWEV